MKFIKTLILYIPEFKIASIYKFTLYDTIYLNFHKILVVRSMSKTCINLILSKTVFRYESRSTF